MNGFPVDPCRCGKSEATEPHPCPHQQEINNDDEFQCTCCDNCRQDCADDI